MFYLQGLGQDLLWSQTDSTEVIWAVNHLWSWLQEGETDPNHAGSAKIQAISNPHSQPSDQKQYMHVFH